MSNPNFLPSNLSKLRAFLFVLVAVSVQNRPLPFSLKTVILFSLSFPFAGRTPPITSLFSKKNSFPREIYFYASATIVFITAE